MNRPWSGEFHSKLRVSPEHAFAVHSTLIGPALEWSDQHDWSAAFSLVTDWPKAMDLLRTEIMLGAEIRPLIRLASVERWVNVGPVIPRELRLDFTRIFLPPYKGSERLLWRFEDIVDTQAPHELPAVPGCSWTGTEAVAGKFVKANLARPQIFMLAVALNQKNPRWSLSRCHAAIRARLRGAVVKAVVPPEAIICDVGRWTTQPGEAEFVVDPTGLNVSRQLIEIPRGRACSVAMRMTKSYYRELRRLRTEERASIGLRP